MATRRFELPGIQDLSKEQEAARALPKEEQQPINGGPGGGPGGEKKEGRQHLIIGGPGTGKSVLALLRARRHQRDGDDYRFLVFNHLLDRASGQLFGEGLASRTWDRWFRGTFRELLGRPVPRKEPDDNGFQAIDWESAGALLQELPACENGPRPYLVIDEGQDMPPEFYDTLVGLGFDRFFVVADQNQQITEANSSRKDIEDCLDIDTAEVIELKHNFRNHYCVARLAREFYTGDPASPPPEIPKSAQGAVPLLCYYNENSLDKVARGILLLADRDPRQLIGVIAPKNTVRERYLHALRSAEVELDNPRPTIETFHGDHRPEVAFDEGGILVINAQACKGLEFDTVVLADIDEHYIRRNDPDVAKRLFYVMVARAKERVFMFVKKGEGREIEKILPENQDVLRRKEL